MTLTQEMRDKMTYALNFVGYWTISSVGPAYHSGIYCVCVGSLPNCSVIYIGESENIADRISTHEKMREWLRVANGNSLNFTPASISYSGGRERAEAAMINHYKPICNVEYVNSFPFPITTIVTTGPVGILNGQFTVQ